MKITIKGNPITKKNSQQIYVNRSTGRPFITTSKQYKAYEEAAMWFLPKLKEPISNPVNVKCEYYMQTKRKVDLVNLQEATLDILVKGNVLADDNSSIVATMDGSRVCYDKSNPRVEIEIQEVDYGTENL